LHKWKFPIYITENGVADATDRIRKNFIRDMLIATHNAIKKGVDVRGYFYWSLIDNYEWHHGYEPKFGLVYIDRSNNLARMPRDSFNYYADICKNGRILE
jgi:beta-glucosidase/6-phospho-beta-glucosidase/beta-galactosidase